MIDLPETHEVTAAHLNEPLPHVAGQRGPVDDVGEQVGPHGGHLLLRHGPPLAHQAVLDEPGGLEEHVVDRGGLEDVPGWESDEQI